MVDETGTPFIRKSIKAHSYSDALEIARDIGARDGLKEADLIVTVPERETV